MAAMFKKLLTFSAAALITLTGLVVAAELRRDHPDSYVVQKGDTLWDIAGRFLDKPWQWPEIWQANPQIENPHLIFPGDVISLAYADGRVRAGITKLSPQIRREPADAVTAIPLSDIEAYLTSFWVLQEGEFENLPYVLGVEEGRTRAASGQVVYVRGMGDVATGERFSVVRPTVRYAIHPDPSKGKPRQRQTPWEAGRGVVYQPPSHRWAEFAAMDNGFEVIGFEVREVATGVVTRTGDPATVLLTGEGVEVAKGDLLMRTPEQAYDLSFMPKEPSSVPSHAAILAVSDVAVNTSGPGRVVALSIGSQDGVSPGDVFSIWTPGEEVADHILRPHNKLAAKHSDNMVQMPEEFNGHVMVFRTFGRVSYGLIMNGIRPTRTHDKLRAPDHL
jgi:hypothetical protein